MARSLQQQLDAVDEAIRRIEEGAQSYTVGARSTSYGQLGELYRQRERLQMLVDRESNGVFEVVRIDRPT